MTQAKSEVNPSAAQACETISAWLSKLANGHPRDWHRLIAEMHALLTHLNAHDLIASDPEARGIIAEMAACSDMEEIADRVDLLALHVRHLVAKKAGRDPNSIHFQTRATARAPLVHSPIAETDARSRTVLRL